MHTHKYFLVPDVKINISITKENIISRSIFVRNMLLLNQRDRNWRKSKWNFKNI